jgi:hypothetical protein
MYKSRRKEYQFNFIFLNVFLTLVHCKEPCSATEPRYHRLCALFRLFTVPPFCNPLTYNQVDSTTGFNFNKTMLKEIAEQRTT